MLTRCGCVGVLIAVLSSLLSNSAVAKRVESPALRSFLQARTAEYFTQHPQSMPSLDVSKDYHLEQIERDAGGLYHVRFVQLHHGIPVLGSTLMVRQRESGPVQSVQWLQPPTRLTIQKPVRWLAAEHIQQRVQRRFPGAGEIRPPTLFWIQHQKMWRLAWVTIVHRKASHDPRRLLYDATTGQLLRDDALSTFLLYPLPGDIQQCSPVQTSWLNVVTNQKYPLPLASCTDNNNPQQILLWNDPQQVMTMKGNMQWQGYWDNPWPLLPAAYGLNAGFPFADLTYEAYQILSPLEQIWTNLTLQPIVLHQNMQRILTVLSKTLGQDGYDDQWSPLLLVPNQDGVAGGWSAHTDGFGWIEFGRPSAWDYLGTAYSLGSIGHELLHNIEQTYYSGPLYGSYCDDPAVMGLEEGVATAFGAALRQHIEDPSEYPDPIGVFSSVDITTVTALEQQFAVSTKSEENNCGAYLYGSLASEIAWWLSRGLMFGQKETTTTEEFGKWTYMNWKFLVAPIGALKTADLLLRMVKYNYPWHWSYAQLAEGLLQTCLDAVGGPVGLTSQSYSVWDCDMVERALAFSGLIPPNAKGVSLDSFKIVKDVHLSLGPVQYNSAVISAAPQMLTVNYAAILHNDGPGSFQLPLNIRVKREAVQQPSFGIPTVDALVNKSWVSTAEKIYASTLTPSSAINPSYQLPITVGLDWDLPHALWQRPLRHRLSVYVDAPAPYEITPPQPIDQSWQEFTVGADYGLAATAVAKESGPSSWMFRVIGDRWVTYDTSPHTYTLSLTLTNIGNRPVYGFLPVTVYTDMKTVAAAAQLASHDTKDILTQLKEMRSAAKKKGLWSKEKSELFNDLFDKLVEVIAATVWNGPYADESDVQQIKALIEQLFALFEDTSSSVATALETVPTIEQVATQFVQNLTNQGMPTKTGVDYVPLPKTDTSLPMIMPGQSFIMDSVKVTAMPGSTVYLLLDPAGQLSELDETNNVFAVQLPAGKTTASPLSFKPMAFPQGPLFQKLEIDVDPVGTETPPTPIELHAPPDTPFQMPLPKEGNF